MEFSTYLKKQLIDFIDSYKKYLLRTSGAAVTFTILCYVVAALLVRYSTFDPTNIRKQSSLLSYFYLRYSIGETYSLVDLIKTVFIFFVATFSIGLLRLSASGEGKEDFSFSKVIQQIRMGDYLLLFLVFLTGGMADFILCKAEGLSVSQISGYNFRNWLHSVIFHLRIYVPMILFSVAIYRRTSASRTRLTFRRIMLLYISLWFFNEFAYEFLIFFRSLVLEFILIPAVDLEKKYIFESFLGGPILAFFFVGYHSVLTFSLKHTEAPLEAPPATL